MDPYISEIRLFAGTFAPQNWMLCAGQLLSIAEYTPLYALIGTTYGGDGQVNFALPDLRGRVPVGAGQGPGLPMVYLGEAGGYEGITLISTEMPGHSHTATGLSLKVVGADANTTVPTNNYLAEPTASDSSGPTTYYAYANSSNTPMSLSMFTGNTGSAGGSQPHENRMTFNCMNYIIAVEGIFPSRN